MITRHLFQLSDTGTFTDTGGPVYGQIKQIRWNPDAGDTGCDLQLTMLPRTGDTGDGWIFYSKANMLGANFFDTNDTGLLRTVAAGDRIQVRVINQAGVATATAGRLYVYVERNG